MNLVYKIVYYKMSLFLVDIRFPMVLFKKLSSHYMTKSSSSLGPMYEHYLSYFPLHELVCFKIKDTS